MSKSYSLFINSTNARNQTLSSTPEDTFIINWDSIFKNETSTHFTVTFEMVTALFASGANDNDIMLSVNFPTSHHFNQTGNPSSIIGTVKLYEYVLYEKFRTAYNDNFGITIQRPTDGMLRVKFVNLDETPIVAFTDYVIIFKFTPII